MRRAALALVASALCAASVLAQSDHVFVGGEPPPRMQATVAGPCSIAPEFPVFLSEGPTDTDLHAPSVGTLRAVMLFAEFPDAPATETTAALFQRIVPESQQWLAEISHGRFALEVTRVDQWYRLPLTSATYNLEQPTFGSMRVYAQEVVALADASVDFTNIDVLLIASPPGARIPLSPTFLAYSGPGIATNEKEIRWGVTFGNDVRVDDWGGRILAHEVQHMLGLPDLYRSGTLPFPDYLRDAGGWDLMSYLRPGAHALAWHKRKLGWIDEAQVVCAITSTEVELHASAAAGGVKAAIVPVDSHTVIVAELRDPFARDANLCDRGVVIYTVDAASFTGQGPVRVHSAGTGEEAAAINHCGPIYDAPFGLRPGQLPRFTKGLVTIDVLSEGEGVARIRITRVPKRRSIRH